MKPLSAANETLLSTSIIATAEVIQNNGTHHGAMGGVGMTQETGGASPDPHDNQDGSQGQQLADFDPNVERQQVGNQAILGDLILDDLGREAEAVEEAEKTSVAALVKYGHLSGDRSYSADRPMGTRLANAGHDQSPHDQ